MKWHSALVGKTGGTSSSGSWRRPNPRRWARPAIAANSNTATAKTARIDHLMFIVSSNTTLMNFEQVNGLPHHRAHRCEALRAQLIECVGILVPWRIVEIDDVEGRNAELNEGHVIVLGRE